MMIFKLKIYSLFIIDFYRVVSIVDFISKKHISPFNGILAMSNAFKTYVFVLRKKNN